MRPDVILRNKSLENREKVRKANTGKKVSDATKEKLRKFNLGKKHSEITKQKLRKISLRLGSKPPSHLGKKRSLETRKKLSLAKAGVPRPSIQGKNHYKWRGGVTEINRAIRGSLEYRLWRKAVFERDHYACTFCGDNKGGNLIADHIKPFSLFPELRFAIDNGRTLCKVCDELLGWKGSYVKK